MGLRRIGEWLRQLDRDASAGRLYSRRVAYVPAWGLAGAMLGAAIAFGLTFLLPETSTVRSPNGQQEVLPVDNSGAVVLLPLAGLLLGLVVGVVAALWRTRRGGRA